MWSWRPAEVRAGPAESAAPRVGATAHGLVFLGAVVLVVVATWPLVRDSADHMTGDAWLFSWVMQSIFRNLVHQPAFLLHGHAFYPLGQSLTFAEPLLTPALMAGPLFVLTGNPVLAYNLTLVLLWAASGWATYAVTRWITGSHGAGLVAMLVFTLAPARMEYLVEFQMEMTFGIPLAVYAWIRFLEAQRLRYLLAVLIAFWAEAVAVWYYAVILATGLAALGIQYVALYWRGWRPRTLGALVGGGLTLGLALAPVAVPFFVTRTELGFERGLDAIDASRSADLVTYLEARQSRVWMALPFRTPAETSLFVGGGALVLASIATLWLVAPRPAARGRSARLLGVATGVCVATAVVAMIAGRPVRIGPIRSLFTTAGVGVGLCLLVSEVLDGARRWRAGSVERRLAERDWVRVLAGTLLLALLLSLGPVVHAGGRRLGGGLYAWIYPFVFPFHAIRSPMRFGLWVLFATAILAGLGMKWLEARIGPRVRGVVVVLAGLGLLGEYATIPPVSVPVWPRAVDTVLAADPSDAAVLEWPLGDPSVDADAEFRSISHGKYVINGFAGFSPAFQRNLSGLLSGEAAPLSTEGARSALRQIYPLRYLLVRLDEIETTTRRAWLALRHAPPALLAFRGTFGDVDLYEVRPTPEVGVTIQRLVSREFLEHHPVLHVVLASRAGADGPDEWVDVLLNDRSVKHETLRGTVATDIRLSPPFRQAEPNVITLVYGSRGRARFSIGSTGATVRGHLRVVSGGQPYGDVASIRLDGVELAPNRRGYNLVALGDDGGPASVAAFDTFADGAACQALVAWVDRLRSGTVVAGAVRDEASGALCPEAVAALGRLGVRGDLRHRFRESHAFVSVKGASSGQAKEALGARLIELEVGRPIGPEGFELRELELRAAGPRS